MRSAQAAGADAATEQAALEATVAELRTQRAGWQNAATMAAELAEKETETRAGIEEEAPAGLGSAAGGLQRPSRRRAGRSVSRTHTKTFRSVLDHPKHRPETRAPGVPAARASLRR